MASSGGRSWFVAGTILYVVVSIIWLFHWVPKPGVDFFSANLRLLFLLGPPLALAKATNPTLLLVYLVGTLLSGWLFTRVVRARTLLGRIGASGALLVTWCLFGLVASAPYF